MAIVRGLLRLADNESNVGQLNRATCFECLYVADRLGTGAEGHHLDRPGESGEQRRGRRD